MLCSGCSVVCIMLLLLLMCIVFFVNSVCSEVRLGCCMVVMKCCSR